MVPPERCQESLLSHSENILHTGDLVIIMILRAGTEFQRDQFQSSRCSHHFNWPYFASLFHNPKLQRVTSYKMAHQRLSQQEEALQTSHSVQGLQTMIQECQHETSDLTHKDFIREFLLFSKYLRFLVTVLSFYEGPVLFS